MIPDLTLYVLVDPQIARGRPLARLAAEAVAGGATLVQYRAKQASTREMVEQAISIREAMAGKGVALLVNDRVDVALAAGADGVHLGRDDMAPGEARRLLGPDAIIGATVKDETDIEALAGQSIDYVCIGGVFGTVHKHNPEPPLGLDGLARLAMEARRRLGPLPVGAIAGIDHDNAADVITAGVDGIAVIGAVLAGDDVTERARRLKDLVTRARSGRP